MKIVLAGSMIFLDKMSDIKAELEHAGHSVVMPALTEEELATGKDTFTEYLHSVGGVENILPDNAIWKMKEEGMMYYKKHMDDSDAMLVCNFDKGEKKNRIGANVFLEMGYMFFLGKRIYVLQGPPYGDDKIEEVLGMRPTFLYGDIEKIKSV
jgi:hypothetical protein